MNSIVQQPAVALPQMMGYGMPQQQPQYHGATLPFGGVFGNPVYVSSMAQVPVGAIPVSQQMLAQALGQGQAGAQVVQPHASITGSVLKGAGIGAAAGAALGVIPFLPLGLFSGAVVGAGVGAGIGLLRGLKARKAEGEFHTMTAQQQAQVLAQAQMNAATPAGARNVATTAEPVAKKAVVMGPEMRKKWAAKVAAERAAAK